MLGSGSVEGFGKISGRQMPRENASSLTAPGLLPRIASSGAAIYLSVWTGLALLFASQSLLFAWRDGQAIDWRIAILSAFHYWYLWAILAIVVVALGRRFSFDGLGWPRALIVHAPAAVVIAIVHVALRALTGGVIFGSDADSFETLFVEQFHLNLLVYGGVVGLSHAYDYHRRSLEQAHRVAQLALDTAQVEARLARSELDQLVMQLQPHFLFNTLQAISTLIHEDVQVADGMLAQLSALLRRVLDIRGVHETELQEELQLLESYLAIQKIRFQGRLLVDVHAEPDTLGALVPPLVLQPLVENAIQHGVTPRTGVGRVTIHANLDGSHLVLAVVDNGPGAELPVSEGIGLRNTRTRLRQMYEANQSLELRNLSEGGLEVVLRLPFREAGNRS